MNIDEFAADFHEDPGYLDFASVGPVGRAVAEEQAALTHSLEHARWNAMGVFGAQDERMRRAVSRLIGFGIDEIVAHPETGTALLHAALGVEGRIALSAAESPSLASAADRAAEMHGRRPPHRVAAEHGRLTPGELRDELDDSVAAVAVSLVDARTGHVADLDGIRQVIGDRLLIVDATQGVGIVDAAWEAADVVAAGGQNWPRAGWGTGFLAVGERAAGRGASGLADPPGSAGSADPIAVARMATAVERMADVGVTAIAARIADRAERVIALADEHGIGVASPRAVEERAGIVVLDPGEDGMTPLVAALHDHGISATTGTGHVRISVHVSTTDDTLTMLGDAFTSFGTTVAR